MLRHTSLLAVLLLAVAPATGNERPNVVLIISDDQAWTDFGFMLHPEIQTPHLDRLAQQSHVFINGYVPTSLCRASLASILTGQYAHQHKITGNDPPPGTDRAEMLRHIRHAPTLPRSLATAGYRSLQTGKYWEGTYDLAGFTAGMTTSGRHGGPGLAIGRESMQPIFDFMAEESSQPFFVWYAPMMPHEPHNPPAELLAKYQAPDRHEKLARYYTMCEWFDQTVGELLDYLDAQGLSDDTLVAFVVDNGWIQELGPERTTRGWFAPKSKSSPYDGGLRTPIMLRWPNKITPGVSERLVSSIDLAPTILAACNVPIPAEMQGHSLLDVMNEATATAEGDIVCGAIYGHDVEDLDQPAANVTHRWCRAGNWKLILPVEGPVELYDLHADPHEKSNVAVQHPVVVRDLTQRLDAWWTPRLEVNTP